MTSGGYLKPLPRIDDMNAPHWVGARERKLRVQRCKSCGTLRYPPNRWCAQCRSDDADWTELSGKGEVWSGCVFHRAYFKGFEPDLPYSVVLVKLDEGLRLYSNLVGEAARDIRVGMRVRAVYERVTDEIALVKFEEDR